MAKTISRFLVLIFLGLGLFAGIELFQFNRSTRDSLKADSLEVAWKNIEPDSLIEVQQPKLLTYRFPDSFDISNFLSPPSQAQSWITWYWHMEKLDKMELLRQLIQIKENGFGGVEIFPIYTQKAPAHPLPLWQYLDFILTAAGRMDIQADILGGFHGMSLPSGVPDSLKVKQLLYGESHVRGGKEIDIQLPKPKVPAYYYLNAWIGENEKNKASFIQGGWEKASLLRVYGIKALEEKRTDYFWDLDDQTLLDADSVFILDKNVNEKGELKWRAPQGYWKIVALYQAPNGQQAYLPGSPPWGVSISPFDTLAVEEHIDCIDRTLGWLSPRARAQVHGASYFSFDYQVDNFYVPDIVHDFDSLKGYKLDSWLPVLLKPGLHHSLYPYFGIRGEAEYILSSEDERIRRDYQEVCNQRFLEVSYSRARQGFEEVGLRSAMGCAGWDFDQISAASKADIPVVDQYSFGGTHLQQYLVASGALLGGRKLLRGRTLGYRHPIPEVSTQEIRMAMDHNLLNGVNQLVFDGASFGTSIPKNAYQPLRETQVFPIGGSGEKTFFWKKINAYLARMQALSQMGKTEVDIAIYYPFDGFPKDFIFEDKHEEVFFNGKLEPVSGDKSLSRPSNLLSRLFDKEEDPRISWLRALWPLVRELEQQGLNWIWVNEEYLKAATWEEEHLQIGEVEAQLLLLPDVDRMEVGCAENIGRLVRSGARVIAYGDIPRGQEGFYDYEVRDQRVAAAMEAIVFRSPMLDPKELRNLIEGIYIPQTISFGDAYPFLRRYRKKLTGQGEINFFQNTSIKERVFQLDIKGGDWKHYWLSAHDGEIYPAKTRGPNTLQGYMHGFGTAVLLSLKNSLADSLLSPLPLEASNPFEYEYLDKLPLKRWDLALGSQLRNGEFLDYRDTLLMDWRDLDELKKMPEEVHYSSKFEVLELEGRERFLLDLGRVNGIATVSVNTREVKTIYYQPYTMDISPYMEEGLNVVEVWVEGFPYFDPKASPMGLLGPALIHVVEGSEKLD